MESVITPKSAPVLTVRRLQAHGLLLALVLWSIYAWVLATPTLRDRNGLLKGTDFLHFYTLGSLALEHRGADLYSMQQQSELAQQKVPQAGHLLYVPLYGPQVSLLFAPLATLPYPTALALWLVFNTILYAICCHAIWKTCTHLQNDGWTVLTLAIAYPAFAHLIAWGQTSGLALACFTAAYLALRSRNFLVAGLAFGSLAFKPQLGIAAAVVFLLAGEWKTVAGAIIAAAAQVSAGWAYYGTAAMRDYFFHLVKIRETFPQLEPRPYQTHSLRAFWAMLLPWPHIAFALYLATALGVLVVTFRHWKSDTPLSLRYSALLVATVLVAPHLTVYDLLILAPAFLFLADYAVADRIQPERRRLGLLLYGCYALPLLGGLTYWTHFQLSIPALLALLWMIHRIPTSSALPLCLMTGRIPEKMPPKYS
jgi:alpha-1,2-mannosyltransferase